MLQRLLRYPVLTLPASAEEESHHPAMEGMSDHLEIYRSMQGSCCELAICAHPLRFFWACFESKGFAKDLQHFCTRRAVWEAGAGQGARKRLHETILRPWWIETRSRWNPRAKKR